VGGELVTTKRLDARSRGRSTLPDDQRVGLPRATLLRENNSARVFFQFAAVGLHLRPCKLDQLLLPSASTADGRASANSAGCTCDGVRMDMGLGGFSRFVRCSFRDVTIRDWICLSVEMIDCTFSGRLETAIFNGTVPEDEQALIGRARNEFHGNDFSAMDFRD